MIAIGAMEDYARLPDLPRFSPYAYSGQFMRERPDFWRDIASALSDDDLVSLIKTLTVAEGVLENYKSGSVAPVIWLFRCLQERKQNENLQPLEDWILSHTGNDYLPWGSSNYGAKSSQEYHKITEAIAARKQAQASREDDRQTLAKQRIATDASQKLIDAVRRKDVSAIHALRLKGADISAQDELGVSALQLANEMGIPALVTALTEELKKT